MLLFFEVITMIFVGIDVAKDTHYAAVSDDSGAVLVKPFAFQNNAEGFCLLLKKLSEFDRSKLLIGLESTGIYSENLICFLYESGFRLAVINPIQTATLRKTAIRKTKTDKVDTMLIIKSLMVNSYRLYSQRDADSLKLRTLCRFRQNLKKSKARLKIQLAGYVNLVFPEFGKFFKSGIHIAASYALLKKYSSPKEIAAEIQYRQALNLCTINFVHSSLKSLAWALWKRYSRSSKKSGSLLGRGEEPLYIHSNSPNHCTDRAIGTAN